MIRGVKIGVSHKIINSEFINGTPLVNIQNQKKL